MLATQPKDSLKLLRVRADLTQAELGEKAGLSGDIISHYEKDIKNLRNARYRNIEKLANALGVTVNDIFLG